MKKKYLKKMLAIMLASMTVSATPGLVGAMKEESKKAIQEANSQIENNTLTTEEATNMLDKLEEMAKEDDEAKKEVSWTLTKMIDQRLFNKRVPPRKRTYYGRKNVSTIKPPPEETISKIIEIFRHCLECDATKRNVAEAIPTMAEDKWLKATDAIEILTKCLEHGDDETEPENYSETKQYVAKAIDAILKIEDILYKLTTDDVSNIKKLLKECFKDNETTVTSAISSLIDTSMWRQSEGCLDTNDILNMLDKSLKDDRSKVYVAKSINAMIKDKFFQGNFPQKRILDMLQACSESDGAQKYVADALSPSSDPENLCDKASFDQCLAILETCSKNNDAKQNVARAIGSMPFFDLINQNSLDKILNILHECSKKPAATFFVMNDMELMKKQGLLDEKPLDETMLCIIELCSKEKETIYVINSMAEKDLLNQCQNDEVKRIVDAVASCIDNNSYFIKTYDRIRIDICQTITTMSRKNILNRCSKDQIKLLVMRLIRIFNQFGAPEAIEAISSMNEKNLLNKLDSYHFQLLISSLVSRFDNDRTTIFTTLAAIAKNNNALNPLYPDELRQLANSLPESLANNNTKEAATIIISAIAKNPNTFNIFNHDQLREILNLFKTHAGNYLANGNYEMVDRIFEVFKKCSEIDDLKADVADNAEMLTNDGIFFQYLDENSEAPRLGNFLDILTSCSSAQDPQAQEKAVCAISAVIRKINTLINASIEIPDKIPQIIEMLEKLSQVEQVKVYVADAIRLLGEKNLLNNQSQADDHRLVNAIDNCLTYGEERISVKESVDDNQQDIAIAVRRIFEDQPWTESFIQHLSPNDAARFIDLAYESKTAADKVGNDVYQSFQ